MMSQRVDQEIIEDSSDVHAAPPDSPQSLMPSSGSLGNSEGTRGERSDVSGHEDPVTRRDPREGSSPQSLRLRLCASGRHSHSSNGATRIVGRYRRMQRRRYRRVQRHTAEPGSS
jgi:hypothetical protein